MAAAAAVLFAESRIETLRRQAARGYEVAAAGVCASCQKQSLLSLLPVVDATATVAAVLGQMDELSCIKATLPEFLGVVELVNAAASVIDVRSLAMSAVASQYGRDVVARAQRSRIMSPI